MAQFKTPHLSQGDLRQIRRSQRRQTLASAKVLDATDLGDALVVTDLSADGAFIQGVIARREFGDRLTLRLELPTDPRPITAAARVVRSSDRGIGVRFEELSARDRSRLRNHAGFYEMDDAIVRLQQSLGDLLPGNLLPLGEPDEIQSVLENAIDRQVEATILRPGRGFAPGTCRLTEIGEAKDLHYDGPVLRIRTDQPLKSGTRVVYVVFSDPPLHYAFEGLVLTGGQRPALVLPPRIYLSERRSGTRAEFTEAYCSFEAPHQPAGRLDAPVLDLRSGGASIALPSASFIVPGTKLPGFSLHVDGERREVAGATVRHVKPLSEDRLRAGLSFELEERERRTFQGVKPVQRRRGIRRSILRSVSLLGGKVAGLLRWPDRRYAGGVEVVRYRTRKGDLVAGLIDANFNTADADIRPDVAVVIAPAILKRKEIFGLLARTLVDDLDRDGHKVVVLRFDASHVVGESSMDHKLVADGRPYYNWTLDHMKADIEASLQYLQRRFRPGKRTLVSLSLSAIPARKIVAEDAKAPIDLWIAPYGCPDAQDMFRNYLAGLELFDAYERGEGPDTILIHGRPISGPGLYGDARRKGMAFLEEAREDLRRIEIPVTWILGTYDHWVTRSRVKAMLQAPGGGIREVFEFATGHVLKTGSDAIEIFKLVAESISKHIFGNDRPAQEPDLARFALQSEAEWARVKRLKLEDASNFWEEHLFGEDDGDVGYDIMLDHPAYPEFLTRQAELLDPQPGEHLADFGCGTGNLTLAMLRALPADATPRAITVLDLVPAAVRRTEQKVEEHYAALGAPMPPHQGLVSDLEVSRLGAVNDFLRGELHTIEELVHRVEGLNQQTVHKLSGHYGKELHAILRGRRATATRIHELCPNLDATEVEVVQELSRAARFLQGQLLPHDMRPEVTFARTAGDLRFEHLSFGNASASLQLDVPDDSFDRVGCSLVVSYLYDPLSALREMHRMLRPGGTLVVSSIAPNFDSSKLYAEEVELLQSSAERGEQDAAGKLQALRRFGNMVSRLIELEEDGRFHFFDGAALRGMVLDAGFSNANVFKSFGSPPTAVIVRAEK